MMRKYGGFEGNAQTLRILSTIERKLTRRDDGEWVADWGLDLTYRSLASVLKYDEPISSVRGRHAEVKKGYYATEAAIVAAVKARVAPKLDADKRFKTIECAIMDIADDIAYSTYDLEDSLHAKFVTPLAFAKALVEDSSIKKNVKEKTNKTLAKYKYPLIEDKDLLATIIAVFSLKLPSLVTTALERTEGSVGAGKGPGR